jgi:hypothetical protein
MVVGVVGVILATPRSFSWDTALSKRSSVRAIRREVERAKAMFDE